MDDENTTHNPEQFVSYSYDIPKSTPASDYPNPGATLHPIAVRVQQSVWYMKESMLPLADDLTQRIKDVGGIVDCFRFDACEYNAIRTKALRCLEQDANSIRAYVDAAIATTTKRIEKATKLMSVKGVNDAVRFQQSALSRARRELAEAEECAMVFDLSGDVAELFKGVRAAIEARASAFAAVKKEAKAILEAPPDFITASPPADAPAPATPPNEEPEDDDVDPSELGFGIPSSSTPEA